MRRLRDLLTPAGKAKYAAWRLSGSRFPLNVRLSTGERLFVRAAPATDAITAYEVFVAGVYRSLGPERDESVRLVVDVGANVGFSVLYWAQHYPNAQIVAFEPHPVHLESIRKHVRDNGISHRVTIHPAAALCRQGEVDLSDAEHCSTVLNEASSASLRVQGVDFFDVVGKQPIDILKVDIEGGEYDLLADARFPTLDVRVLVMEWHRTTKHDDGREWCCQRLREAGYAVQAGLWSGDVNGLLWGFRTPSSAGNSAQR